MPHRATSKERAQDQERAISRRFGVPTPDREPELVFADDARGTCLLFEKSVVNKIRGLRVQTVPDAVGLRRHLRQRSMPPQAVVCDYHLGDEDGNQILRDIRKDDPDILLILISAYDDVPPDLMKLGAAGIDAVARKPWNSIALATMIQSLLDKPPEERAAKRVEDGSWHQAKFVVDAESAGRI